LRPWRADQEDVAGARIQVPSLPDGRLMLAIRRDYAGSCRHERSRTLVDARENPNAGRPCCCQAEHFTDTEIEVLCLLAEGLSNLEIAGRMSVSGHTVDRHVTQMLRRSGARNRAGLVSAAFRAGVLMVDEYKLRPTGRRCLLA
jgi:DNA-binding NarL/FixJ family response regulator